MLRQGEEIAERVGQGLPLAGWWESNPQQAYARLFLKQVPIPFGYEGTLCLAAARKSDGRFPDLAIESRNRGGPDKSRRGNGERYA